MVDELGFDAPSTKEAVALLDALGVDRQGRSWSLRPDDRDAAKSFAQPARVHVVSARRAQHLRRAGQRLRRVHHRHAARLTKKARPPRGRGPALRRRRARSKTRVPAGRRNSEGSTRRHPAPSGEREVLRAARLQRLHLRGRPGCLQAGDPRRRPGHLARREGAQGQHAEPQGQEDPQPAVLHLRQPRRHQAGHRHPRRVAPSTCSRGTEMAVRKRKPTSPGRRFQTVVGLRRGHRPIVPRSRC